MKRLAIFVSGNGTNFEALVTACEQGRIDARVCLMVCDHTDAYALERAAKHNIETFAFSPKQYATKAQYEAEIVQLLDSHSIDLICLAGYMRLISDLLLGSYGGRIINIHPSLLPAFKGAHAIEQAFDYGVKIFGVSIHWVDATMDGGKIIAQESFHYTEGETVEQVEERIHAIEHVLYPKTVQKLIDEGKI